MFVQDNLQTLKEVFDTNFPQNKFFTMFIGTVLGLLMFVKTRFYSKTPPSIRSNFGRPNFG